MAKKDAKDVKDAKRKKVLRTFNLDGKLYEEFSRYCKEFGISMSKRVESFIKQELDKIRVLSTRMAANSHGVMQTGKKSENSEKEHSFKKYC